MSAGLDHIDQLPALDVLLATLLYLMSRHAQSPNVALSKSIISHLKLLESHPDCSSAALTKAGERLTKHWDGAMRTQQPIDGPEDPMAKPNALWKIH